MAALGRQRIVTIMAMNVLLPHVRRNVLPRGFLDAPELGRVSVITEPGHLQRYGPEVDVHLVDSIQDLERVRRATMQILSDGDLHRILSPFELSVPVAGYLRSYFGLPGQSFEAANLFANKYLMKRRAAADGLPGTAFRVACTLANVMEKAAEIGWPVVIKPVLGGGSLDVVVFDGPDAFAEFCASPSSESIRRLTVPLIVEEYVELESEYHCDGIVHDGDVLFAAPSKYVVPMLGCPAELNASYTLPPAHPDRAGILYLHARMVRALGLQSGVTHMEFLKTRDSLLPGEIACRPGGAGIPEAIWLQYGVDIWRAFRETSLGLEPEVRPTEREGLLVNYLLPIKPGRIVRLSTAAELAAVPSVVRVDMSKQVGDVMRDRVGSSATTGVVYLSVRDETEVSSRIRELAERYVLEVEQEDEVVASPDSHESTNSKEEPCCALTA
jgi:L-aminoacid ligase-like protein